MIVPARVRRVSAARQLSRLFLFLLCAFVTACGPTVHTAPGFEKGSVKRVALLPTQFPNDMPRERAQVIHSLVGVELRRRGYTVLDDALVTATCGTDAPCKDVRALEERHKLDGVFQLTVDSLSRNNLLVGFYNTLSGKLVLFSPEGPELIAVEQTEHERGGVLFNAGQIIQGIKSQLENTGDASFTRLAERFAKSIVDELPSERGGDVSPAAVSIERVELRPVRPGVSEICVRGTPSSIASLVLNRERTSLREVSAGRYCGIYRVSDALASGRIPTAELRSSFGTVTTVELSQLKPVSCTLDNLVFTSKEGSSSAITVSCVLVGSKRTAAETERCDELRRACELREIVIYRAASPLGPYKKVAETAAPHWVDPASAGEDKLYEVVGVERNGVKTAPSKAQLKG